MSCIAVCGNRQLRIPCRVLPARLRDVTALVHFNAVRGGVVAIDIQFETDAVKARVIGIVRAAFVLRPVRSSAWRPRNVRSDVQELIIVGDLSERVGITRANFRRAIVGRC